MSIPDNPADPTPRAGEFNGRVVLITGAAGPSLGNACAQLFAAAGAHVVITDRSQRRLDLAAEALAPAAPNGVTSLVLDVADEVSIKAGITEVINAQGRLDVLVNNAAFTEQSPLVDTTTESWRRVLDVALNGPFLLMRETLPHMYRQGSGSIVNIASVDAWGPAHTNIGSYVAAKAGLIGLGRVGAAEGGPHGVRVNTVAPGLMVNKASTELHEGSALDAVRQATALRRGGDPLEVAQAVYFLASDAASFITGEVLAASGGLYFRP
jgi:3-oxoacyl-[acyl-carrier protein] reductase